MMEGHQYIKQRLAKAGFAYMSERELKEAGSWGEDFRIDFRHIGDCYQVRGHIDHTETVYKRCLQAQPGQDSAGPVQKQKW